MSNVWFNSFAIAALVVCRLVFSNTEDLSYKLTPSSILIGERAYLEVRLKTEGLGDNDMIPEVVDELLTSHKGLLLLQKDIAREGSEIVWKYHLTAYSTQEYTVPPIQIRFGANTYSTESINLKVLSNRPETDEEIRAEFGAVMAPVNWKQLGMLFLGLIVFLLVLKKCLTLFKRIDWKKVKAPIVNAFAPKINAKLWLKTELERLRMKVNDSTEESDLFVDELTQVLKTYFTLEMHAFINAKTSGELGDVFKAHPEFYSVHPLFK